MKKHLLLLSLLFFSALAAKAFTYKVVIKGYIKDSSGLALSGKAVIIYSNDSTSGCLAAHSVLTNPNGYYTDTITCSSPLHKLFIAVENCKGERILRDATISNGSGTIEVNFTICNTVPPPPPASCKAVFTYTYKDSIVYFNSAGSYAPAGDSIISRIWSYTDSSNTAGSFVLQGNVIDTFIRYSIPGSYAVHLVIRTKKGCESHTTVIVVIPPKNNTCTLQAKAAISEKISARKFRFSSSMSTAPGDSIISRKWTFGDGTGMDGHEISPLKEYKDTGIYNVCVLIKTKKGCEQSYCMQVVVKDSTANVPPPVNCKAGAQFTAVRISPKKVQFSSQVSYTASGDSIVQRKWKFGDGSVLEGNTVAPVKEYPFLGVYTACLTVKTAKGCVAEMCKQVTVQDTALLNQSSVNFIKIISLNPNPVTTRMLATVWSRNANAEAEITVIDIYGTVKLTQKKILAQGNNIIEVAVANLYRGPYFLKVSARGSRDSKAFYKL
jgi:PKD repeat protein